MNRMGSYLLNFFLLSILLSACSGEHHYGQPLEISSSNGQTTYHFATALEASYSATQFKLSCKTTGMCPETVGSMIHHNESDLSVCTFSLIAEDIAISNRHCISEKIAKRGASCNGIIEFILLDHNSASTSSVFQCDKVLSVPEEYSEQKAGTSQRDFAIFHIYRTRPNAIPKDNPRVNPFDVDQKGFPSGEDFHVIVTDPLPDSLGSVIREQNCTSIINPIFSSNYAVPTDPAVTFEHCRIVHGNSGSPILDASYKLRGIINQFSFNEALNKQQIKDAQTDAFALRELHIQQLINKLDIAFGVNFSCIDLLELGLKRLSQQACTITSQKNSISSISPINTPEFQKQNQLRLNKIRLTADQSSEVFKWQWSQPNSPDWGIEMHHHRLAQELTPFCFNGIYDDFNWRNAVPTPDQYGDTLFRINLGVDVVDEDVDPSLKLIVVYSTKPQSLVFKFNMNELLQSAEHATNVSIERSGFILGKSNLTVQKVGFCYHYTKK